MPTDTQIAEGFERVAAGLEKAPAHTFTNKVDMRNLYVSQLLNRCGSPACHGGWIAFAAYAGCIPRYKGMKFIGTYVSVAFCLLCACDSLPQPCGNSAMMLYDFFYGELVRICGESIVVPKHSASKSISPNFRIAVSPSTKPFLCLKRRISAPKPSSETAKPRQNLRARNICSNKFHSFVSRNTSCVSSEGYPPAVAGWASASV